jgi:type I restriction enzyme, S subunit
MNFEDWKTHKLGAICLKIGSGATPKGGKEVYLDSGEYAFIRSQNVLDFSFSYDGLAYINERQAQKLNNVSLIEKDILLNITGDSVARVCQVPKSLLPARVNQHVSIIRPIENIANSAFLKYYLLNPRFKNFMLVLSSVGGTRNALTKVMIEDFEITLPNLATQTRIAAILTSLDDKIELNRQTNATLEAMAQTLFQEMCLPKKGEDMEGWREGKLGEVVAINMGQSPAGSSYNQTGEGMIFFQGKAEFGFRFPTIDKYTTEPKKIAQKFDTLLSVRAPVGTINMTAEKCCIGRGLSAISGKNNCWSFTFYLLKSLEDKLDNFNGEGTVFGAINKTDLGNLEIMIPPPKNIEDFEQKGRAIDELIFNNEQETQTLTTLRDSLLPKLMRGEIAV